jgi:hypothetical protein
MTIPFSSAALAHLHASFLAIVLPRVLSHGRVCLSVFWTLARSQSRPAR